jgi:hypothetical protein
MLTLSRHRGSRFLEREYRRLFEKATPIYGDVDRMIHKLEAIEKTLGTLVSDGEKGSF